MKNELIRIVILSGINNNSMQLGAALNTLILE